MRGGRPLAVGILPALGSGLTDLRRTGQHARLLDYDLRHYAGAWERLYYFSYFDESLADFTRDPLLGERVVVVPRPRHWPVRLYALAMPLLHRARFLECAALRVEQFSGVVPALVARALFGLPFVVTYGYHYAEVARLAGSRVKPALYGLLERLIFPRAAGVIVASEEMAGILRTRRRPPRLVLVPNGVDTAQFAPARREAAPAPGRSVLYVGRLEPEKNLARLIDAVAPLGDAGVRLVLVGDGSLRAALEARARAAGVRVEFAGVVPHGELPKRFADSDVFVLPSLTEGHPKALIEAMACGTPCAASARGGIPTLVEDGVTGLLFDPEDPAAITRALRTLLGDAGLARRLADAARRAAVERYDVHRLLADEVAFVRSVARSDGAGRFFEDYAEAFPIDDVLPEFVERRLTDLARARPRAVLDVGAGDGRWVGLLRRLVPDALVVGCEISLLRARRMRAKGLRVVAARAEALPFRAGRFDLVTLVEVLEHTESPATSLDEIRRVLRPGGQLALTTPNYPVKRLYDLRAALRSRDVRRLRDDPTHISPLSAGRLEGLLRPRFASVALEGTAILGEGRLGWLRRLKTSRIGRALANKLFALCVKAR